MTLAINLRILFFLIHGILFGSMIKHFRFHRSTLVKIFWFGDFSKFPLTFNQAKALIRTCISLIYLRFLDQTGSQRFNLLKFCVKLFSPLLHRPLNLYSFENHKMFLSVWFTFIAKRGNLSATISRIYWALDRINNLFMYWKKNKLNKSDTFEVRIW